MRHTSQVTRINCNVQALDNLYRAAQRHQLSRVRDHDPVFCYMSKRRHFRRAHALR
jgi:hypothetical protein